MSSCHSSYSKSSKISKVSSVSKVSKTKSSNSNASNYQGENTNSFIKEKDLMQKTTKILRTPSLEVKNKMKNIG
jgi:hypothetical protein